MKKLVLIAGILLSLGHVRAEDWAPFPIGPFGTLNDRDSSYAIPADKAQALLNVNITPGGKSVKKREGYGLSTTLTITTSPVHGIYTFFDSNGNTVDLFAHDTRFTSSISGGSPSVLFSTGPNGATYQCTDSLGFAYCANSNRTTVIKTNGSTYSQITNVNSTGTMVAACVTRLAMAGFSDSPSRIDLSADTDFATWSSGSLGTSGVQLVINAPGAKITHIVYAFGRLIWFKDTSFGYIMIGNQPLQTDWVVKTVAFDVGTNDNTSVYREGYLYFRGKDSHIYRFDGSNYERLSREIAGTIGQSQTRAANSWTQTTQADFQAGATNPAGWISTSVVSGSIVLGTAAAVSPFTDTSGSDFTSGTLTQVSTIVVAGSLTLSFSNQLNLVAQTTGTDGEICSNECTGSYYQSQQVNGALIPAKTILSSVSLLLQKTGSPGDHTLYFKADGGGIPGTTLESVTVPAASVATSTGFVVVNFSSTTRLASGTTYFIQLVPNGTCDASNKIIWRGQAGVGVTLNNGCGSSPTTSFIRYAYNLYTTTFNSSGNLVSRSFDVGHTTNSWLFAWSTFTVSESVSGVSTIGYETQTSSSTNGVWNTLVSVSTGTPPTSSVQQFIRYKASFATTDQNTTPTLNDVTLNMTSRLRPSATFYSAVNNASSLTTWDTFNPTKQDNGGTHSFSIRSSTNPITVNSSTPTWTSLTANGVPTVSTGAYFQIADLMNVVSYSTLTITTGPRLDDFTQNWFEGAASDKAYATYFDDKIWWSVASGAGATSNNKILLYDLMNQGWLVYDITSNGFLVRNNRLYFGSSTSGYIFKYGDTDSDNGSAITSYWKSKDYFGISPFATNEIANISFVAGSVANSSMTITYSLNGSNDTSYTMSLYNPSGSFTKKNKIIAAGTVANTYAVKFGNTAADQPFEVFGIQVGIRPKSWAATP